MKKKYIKMIASILIIFTLFNFILAPRFSSNYVYADRATSTGERESEVIKEEEESAEEETEEEEEESTSTAKSASETEAEVEDSVAGKMNGIIGFLTLGGRAFAVILGALLQLETYSVLISGSTTANIDNALISPFDIFFNKFALININIFQTDDVEEGSFVYTLRSNVAAVALVMQIIAVVILVIRCLIGIAKQFLSNVGEQKKEGRDLAEDSFISFCMVLFMDLIMFAIISLNEAFLSSWEGIASALDMSDVMASLRSQALSINFILGTGCCIVYVILTIQTMKFALTYILRWIMVAVLIIVAPLTPIFYSHSQAKNGSSGVFGRWFRLFTSNVMLQTIHGILYLILVAIPLSSLIASNSSVSTLDSLGACVVLVICVMYVNKVEKMLRYIFGIENDVVSFSMVNNSIHNMVNRVSDVAIGGATMVSNVANNGFSLANVTNFGQDVSTSNQTTNNNIIHQFGERAGSMFGIGTSNGGHIQDGPMPVQEGDAEEVHTAETAEATETAETQEIAEGENAENPEGENPDGQNPVLAPVPPTDEQGELSEEELEESAKDALKDAIEQASKEGNETTNTENVNVNETNETNESTVNTEVQTADVEDVEAEIENMNVEPENEKDLADKYDEIISKIEEAKANVDSLKADLEELKEATKSNGDELNELGEKIGIEKEVEIQDLIDKMVSDKGIDYVSDNAQNIIGNNTMTNEEAAYMEKYISNLADNDAIKSTEEELAKNERIYSNGSKKLEEVVANGMASEIISESTAMALEANLDNVKNGGIDLSQAILAGNVKSNTNADTTETATVATTGAEATANNGETETIASNETAETTAEAGATTTDKGEMANPDVKVDNSGEIPSDIVDQALQTEFVQNVMLENAEKLQVVGGEVTNDGKLTGEAVARIMKGMSEGTYSPENYNALREKVRQAGEEHLLQQCESNFTAENAAKLTSDAGKQCVQFMAEQSIGTSISVTSQLINMGATMTVASTMQGDIVDNGSTNVLNSLQNRKTAVGG